jgi:hypothetical protein
MPETAEKWGICVRAAEAWATEGDELPERLRAEVEAARVAYKQAEDEDEDYRARRDDHRREWGHLRVVRGEAWARMGSVSHRRPPSPEEWFAW